jgi:hypothetical protein
VDSEQLKRFMAKVEITLTCWLWKGASQSNGYGRFDVDGRTTYAHRTSYEHFVGAIAEGLTLDHLCRTRLCVRPDHLEPVTNKENLMRGMSFSARNAVKINCPRGHEYSDTNTYTDRRGRRFCKTCRREGMRAIRRGEAAA